MKPIQGTRETPIPGNPIWKTLDKLAIPPDPSKAVQEQEKTFQAMLHAKHPRSIAVVNYKGGVGKTTATFFLGAQIANDEPPAGLLYPFARNRVEYSMKAASAA